jgi:hypothetical protein
MSGRVRLMARAPEHSDRSVYARIARLHRELAAAYEELEAEPKGGPDFLDVTKALPAVPRRALLEACRAGELAATKKGRNWYATSAEIRRWMQARGPVAVSNRDDVDDLDDLRAKLARPSPNSRRRSS